VNVLTNRRDVMGGEAVITIVGGTSKLLDDAFAVAEACDQAWSRFRSDSEVGALNEARGVPVQVSPLTVALVAEMVEGFTLTDGDFNPTLLPAVVAAGYRSSLVRAGHVTNLVPEARVFDSLSGIAITDETVQLPVGMTLDSGGIGKGFAADLIAAAVMNSGARGVMVSMSGDIVVAGESPELGGWRLAVENPFDESEHVEVVRLAEGAVVTSSQRKKRFEGGHHLINPKTLTSAETTVQTVSVIAATGARAEVLAKSGFLRPTADYLEWLPSVGAAGMVIEADGSRLESANWADYR
jgi:thiamine biosynthesis lipoprotein